MTPDDENRRLALAVDKLEIAVGLLRVMPRPTSSEGADSLETVEHEVRAAHAALEALQRARYDALATSDVWAVLELIVQEFIEHEGAAAWFDSRVVARAIALSRERQRDPAPRVDTTVLGRSSLDVVGTEGGKATVEHRK